MTCMSGSSRWCVAFDKTISRVPFLLNVACSQIQAIAMLHVGRAKGMIDCL